MKWGIYVGFVAAHPSDLICILDAAALMLVDKASKSISIILNADGGLIFATYMSTS